MQRNRIVIFICILPLLIAACSKKEEKDDFFVFDFGTEGRMILQGHLKGDPKKGFEGNDLGGVLISMADEIHEMEVAESGGSWAISVLAEEGVKQISIKGNVEKEIFVASSYYDHSAQEQVILFIENIGLGEINYTISIEDILALRKKVHNQSR